MDKIKVAGLELIPLWLDGGKMYRPSGWQKNDYTDLDWSAKFEDYSKAKDSSFMRPPPNAYGVRGGESVVIIDIDNKEPGLADKTLRDLELLGLDLDTLTVKSKSGGYHLYYNRPDFEVKTCTGWMFNNVDIRGRDGYVVGPDVSKSEWVEGSYTVVVDMPIIDCGIDLPLKGASAAKLDALPKIEDIFGNGLVNGEVPIGGRDQYMLKLSGAYVAAGLTDEQIAEEFSKIRFAHAKDDNPTLDDLMFKIGRDRQQKDDIMGYALNRFIFDLSNAVIYDVYYNVGHKINDMIQVFPAKMMVMVGDKPVMTHVIKAWIDHPDRVNVHGRGLKPCPDKIYMDNGFMYYNTYEPPKFEPWSEEVSAKDPDIVDYLDMVSNLCNKDEHTTHMYHSQRAAKIQNPLWTPHWGFVITSRGFRIGKDFSLHVFSRLLGNGSVHFKEAEISDIRSGRNEYYNNALLVLINEPGGLKDNFSSNTVMESIKKLFSETEITVKRMYEERTNMLRTYRIPEMHSNVDDAIKISEGNRRFAPIICTSRALHKDVYMRIGALLEDPEKKMLRKLMRYYLDYEVSKEIVSSTCPAMADEIEAIITSQGEGISGFMSIVEDRGALLSSDLQTIQSLQVAITEYLGLNKTMARKLVKHAKEAGLIVPLTRSCNIPVIEYDTSNISSEENRVCRLPGKAMVQVYTIRDHENHAKRKSRSRYVKDNFFPLPSDS